MKHLRTEETDENICTKKRKSDHRKDKYVSCDHNHDNELYTKIYKEIESLFNNTYQKKFTSLVDKTLKTIQSKDDELKECYKQIAMYKGKLEVYHKTSKSTTDAGVCNENKTTPRDIVTVGLIQNGIVVPIKENDRHYVESESTIKLTKPMNNKRWISVKTMKQF